MPLDPAEAFAALTPEEQAALLARANPPAADTPPPAPLEPAGEASPWAELDDFYDDTLQLKYGGREYVLHAVDVQTGLLCQRLVNLGLGALTDYNLAGRAIKAQEGAEDTLDDSTEEDLYRRLLGGDTDHPGYAPENDVWRQLFADRVPWPLVRHMGVTALMWAGRDRTTALDYWLGGARPKAQPTPDPPTPKTPQDRRASGKGGGARTTPRPASTSSTTSRAAKPKKGTPGRTS